MKGRFIIDDAMFTPIEVLIGELVYIEQAAAKDQAGEKSLTVMTHDSARSLALGILARLGPKAEKRTRN
jgi:hypothetical protein